MYLRSTYEDEDIGPPYMHKLLSGQEKVHVPQTYIFVLRCSTQANLTKLCTRLELEYPIIVWYVTSPELYPYDEQKGCCVHSSLQ